MNGLGQGRKEASFIPSCLKGLASVHPEMAIFTDFGVGLKF